MAILPLVIILGLATAAVLIWRDHKALVLVSQIGGIAFLLQALLTIAKFLLGSSQ